MLQSPRIQELRSRYERWFPLAFFVGGFFFDVLTLDRIDSPVALVQQSIYLAFLFWVLTLDILADAGKFAPGPRFSRLWKYREPAVSFVLGSLMSVYMLFYFKSASAFTSLFFVLVVSVLMIVNEFARLGEAGAMFRMAMFALCLFSYFVCVVPIVFGEIGLVPFVASLVVTALPVAPVYRWLARKVGPESRLPRRRMLLPFAATGGTFLLLYLIGAIPPVPLSLSYIGVYHGVEKSEGQFKLALTRSPWRFWEKGDQTFLARPGDKVFAFARVFSPTRFKDKILVRWAYKDPSRGWSESDAIPIQITGGRDEGFRGFAYKGNYTPGDWRVRIESADGRELGGIDFEVIPDSSTEPRELRYEIQ